MFIVFSCRPHDTPFEDGTFKLTIEFTEEYPNKPPTVRFVSKMFHPNGEYCQTRQNPYMGRVMRKPTMWFSNRSDTNPIV